MYMLTERDLLDTIRETYGREAASAARERFRDFFRQQDCDQKEADDAEDRVFLPEE